MIHPIDGSAALLLRHGPRRMKFFTGGWGDPEHLEDLDVHRLGPPADLELEWSRPRERHGFLTSDGRFSSPLDRLPDRCRTGHVRLLLPHRSARRVVVLMAAWNDHGYRTRTKLAEAIAPYGIGAALLENPYYGARRPDPAVEQPITTVARFAAMGRAAVEEARALLVALRSRFELLGVGGYSMGGSVGALVSAVAPFPVATVPLAAADSPAPVYTQGVLRNGVDWDALGGPQAINRLDALLERASTVRHPAPPHARHAVLVAATRDGFVPAAATRRLHEHWRGSELRWLRAGHGTMLWFARRNLAAAAVASFDRLAAAQRAAGS